MADTSARHALPLLVSGQSQKEITHNEALARVDALATPVVEAVFPAAIPTAPLPGQCWIIGASPSGAWADQTNAMALWTEGGWRFLTIPDGGEVWSRADDMAWRRTGSGWEMGHIHAQEVRVAGVKVIGAQQAAIADPSGGSTVDAESRLATTAILAALRNHGLIG